MFQNVIAIRQLFRQFTWNYQNNAFIPIPFSKLESMPETVLKKLIPYSIVSDYIQKTELLMLKTFKT